MAIGVWSKIKSDKPSQCIDMDQEAEDWLFALWKANDRSSAAAAERRYQDYLDHTEKMAEQMWWDCADTGPDLLQVQTREPDHQSENKDPGYQSENTSPGHEEKVHRDSVAGSIAADTVANGSPRHTSPEAPKPATTIWAWLLAAWSAPKGSRKRAVMEDDGVQEQSGHRKRQRIAVEGAKKRRNSRLLELDDSPRPSKRQNRAAMGQPEYGHDKGDKCVWE